MTDIKFERVRVKYPHEKFSKLGNYTKDYGDGFVGIQFDNGTFARVPKSYVEDVYKTKKDKKLSAETYKDSMKTKRPHIYHSRRATRRAKRSSRMGEVY